LESLRDENHEEARRARQVFQSIKLERAVPPPAAGGGTI
jgi:hypothetical protein